MISTRRTKKDTTKENAKYNFTTSKNEWLLQNF
jgi:hypothetical protein